MSPGNPSPSVRRSHIKGRCSFWVSMLCTMKTCGIGMVFLCVCVCAIAIVRFVPMQYFCVKKKEDQSLDIC